MVICRQISADSPEGQGEETLKQKPYYVILLYMCDNCREHTFLSLKHLGFFSLYIEHFNCICCDRNAFNMRDFSNKLTAIVFMSWSIRWTKNGLFLETYSALSALVLLNGTPVLLYQHVFLKPFYKLLTYE